MGLTNVNAAVISDPAIDPAVDAIVTMQKRVSVVATGVTNNTAAYTAADFLGTKLTFTNAARAAAGSGIIESIIIRDLDNQKAALDLVFFHTDPTATTFTDNGAVEFADADVLNAIGFISVLAADYITTQTTGGNAVATKLINLPFKLPLGLTFYAGAIVRGTPTYATNNSALQYTLYVRQD